MFEIAQCSLLAHCYFGSIHFNQTLLTILPPLRTISPSLPSTSPHLVPSIPFHPSDSCNQWSFTLLLYNKIAIMQRQRRQATHREHPIRNPEMSVKIPAKKPLHIPRNTLAGQQSAHRPTRLPRPLLSSEHCSTGLQDAVRSSGIYRLLEEEMAAMASRHQMELLRLREAKTAKEEQLARMKREEFATKMQIWELKNEVLELKESIRQERQEEARLQEQLGQPCDDPLPHNEPQEH